MNLQVARKVQDSDINWTKISRQLEKKSRDDCRNFWANRVWASIGGHCQVDFEEEDEEELVRQIMQQGPERDSDIRFQEISNGHKEDSNRAKYH